MSKEFLLECSRNKSFNTNSNTKWSNIVNDGLILNEGDQVSLNSAYLNSNGVQEEDTIFLTGNKIQTKVYSNRYNHTNKLFDRSYTYEQYDNKMEIRNQFYKSEDGEYMVNNPFSYFAGGVYKDSDIFGSEVVDPDSDSDSVITPIQTTNFFSSDPPTLKYDDIDVRYLREYKNRRLTIFERDLSVNPNSNNFFDYVYYPYEQTFKFELPKGYVNKGKISSEITRQMNNINSTKTSQTQPVRKESEALGFRSPPLASDHLDLKDGFNTLQTSLIKETSFLKSINAGTDQTMSRQAYATFKLNTNIDLYKQNFNYIGVLYYNTFFSIRKFLYSPKFDQFNNEWIAQWGQEQDLSGNRYDLTLNINTSVPPVANQKFEISLFFNDENAKALYDVFNAQLLDYDVLTDASLNPNTERFMHIQASEDFTHQGFGTDMYFDHLCHILKVHIDPNNYGNAQGDGISTPKYGFLWRGDEVAPNSGIYFSKLYLTLPNDNVIKYPLTSGVRKIGFSRAASSYGNQNCCFFNGLNTDAASNFGIEYKITYNGIDYFTAPTIKEFYIGCMPVFTYNQEENRFEIKNLHLQKKLGNDLRAPTDEHPQETQAGDNIYIINPKKTQTNNPQIPNDPDLISATTRNYYVLKRWTIFDSYSGCFFDFGIDKEYYKNSLWYLLGFQEELIFPDIKYSKRQILNNYLNYSYPFTTNVNIQSLDINEFSVNPDGLPTFVNQQGIIQFAPLSQNNQVNNKKVNLVEIVVSQISSNIPSKNISINNNQGVLFIKSNIIPNKNYMDGTIHNIVGIIDRSYLVNDFIYSKNDDLIFTIDKKTIINNIDIEIVNADNSQPLLDENSIVIFKIIKNIDVKK